MTNITNFQLQTRVLDWNSNNRKSASPPFNMTPHLSHFLLRLSSTSIISIVRQRKTPTSICFVVFSHPQSSLFQISLSSCKQRHFIRDPDLKAQVKKKAGVTNFHK
ncbi:hypothetical protein L2E82_30043 [Cichorium intybus]|uniref:Uncharacterized protein n=1 Tax=Cichorium intybus TaxID=13427 RepID=A0ACB9CZK7_CICIN|nr:hypothetical protein L2E82_30043 [Cichorium intybus]